MHTRIGFSLESVLDLSDKNNFDSEKLEKVGVHLKNVLANIPKDSQKTYLFIPHIKKGSKDSIRIEKWLHNFNIDFSKIIYCENDLVGAIREYRTDIIVLPETQIEISEKDSSFFEKGLAEIESHYRKIYNRKNLLAKKRVLELEDLDLFIDYIPQYTQVVYIGSNRCQFEDSSRVQFINNLYEFVGAIEIAKKNIKARIDGIYKSYDYKPKTGIISIDEDWKRYWSASKYEDDYFDQITQKFSRLEFLEYHNRFNLDDIMIDYLPLNVQLTYREVFKKARVLCKSFASIGVKKGTVVTMCMPNTIEDYLCELALNHIGAIINPLHPLATQEKLERFFKTTNPEYFICLDMDDMDNTINLNEIINKFNINETIVISQVDSANPIVKVIYKLQRLIKAIKQKNSDVISSRYLLPDKYITFNELYELGKNYDGEINIEHNPSDSAFYYTTGGTTSNSPKMVDIPYSLINNAYYNSYGIDIEKGQAAIINYPRYIAFSDSNCMHLPASAGLKLIMTPFEYPENFAQVMQDKKVAVIQVAPQFYQMMLDDEKKGSFDNIDLSHVRFAVAGGDKLDEVLKNKIKTFFARHNNPNVRIITGYGCTELNGSSIVQLFETNENVNENNVGIPLPNFKFKLINDDKKEVTGSKQQGRLLIGGSGMTMNGYLNQEESSNEVLLCDDKGDFKWYDTADIVRFHSADVSRPNEKTSCEFITREKRFVMITRSECSGKAIPDDIENIIQKNIPGILKCSVVGVVEDEQMTLRAAVVLEDGVALDTTMIEAIKQVCTKTDVINTLSDVIALDSLPLTERQKVNYREVERIFEEKIEKEKSSKIIVKK